MDKGYILKLISEDESDYLDFKSQFHSNKSELLHDILCLSNSLSKNDRYLIFGVKDKTKEICGIEGDSNRLNQANIIDFLRSKQLNNLPSIKLITLEIDNHQVDVLTIKNVPEKPYFLLKDYTFRGKTVRAGVIYTRDNDVNTPIDKCSSEVKLEKMFQERFGILDSPLIRFENYLKDASEWKYDHNEEGALFFFYKQFPEFKLEVNEREDRDFSEPWLLLFPDSKGTRDEFLMKYHTTIIGKIYVVWCDGARLPLVVPNQYAIDPPGICVTSYYWIRGSIKDLVQNMILSTYQHQSRFYIDDVVKYFNSSDEAKAELDQDYQNNPPLKFTYFYFDNNIQHYFSRGPNGTFKLKKS